MTSKDLKLDHYKLYDVPNQKVSAGVKLKGQFDKEPELAEVVLLDFFANPVSKRGEPIYNKHAHLTFYRIYEHVPDPSRVVVAQNQFGTQKLITGPAVGLLVPALKYEPGAKPPEGLEHYKVYHVLEGAPVNKTLRLADQFGADKVKATYPFAFAVPVDKEHGGKKFPILNERAHLLFYKITPRSVDKTYLVRDQFGKYYLHGFRSFALGVPSVKREWKPAK